MPVAATPVSSAHPRNEAALVGGIVGGVVALLLVGGLIAFVVALRRRRRRANREPNKSAALHSVRQSTPNDGARDTGIASHRSNYGIVGLPAALNDDYTLLAPNRAEYEIGNVTT